jgi:type II secretory pathway component PulK
VIPQTNTANNINTASLEMLESIPALAGHGAQIIQDRDGNPDNTDDDAPFASMNDFQQYAQQTLQIQNINTQGLQVYSEYFMMESYTNLGAGNIRLFSLIYRNQSDGSSEIIYQSRGTL